MSYRETKQFGGGGVSSFKDDLTVIEQLIAVSIRHGSRVDSIMGIWSTTDGKQEQGKHHGGEGGSQSIFVLEKGEHIDKVTVRHGAEVDSLEFHTTQGRTFGPYGGDGGTPTEVNGEIYGFFGRSGRRIDAIGFFVPDID